MKIMLTTIALCFTLLAFGQETSTVKLVVRNFDGSQGKIKAELYNAENEWLDKAFLELDTVIYSTDEVTMYIPNVPAGEYSIAIFHDENENGELDMNSFGIPEEAYAFSNNAAGMFGPAKYKDAAFQVTGKETVHVIDLN